MTTFQDEVDALIARMLERVEKEVPEFGDFCPVLEFFGNMDEEMQHIVGKYGLKLYKMPKDIVADPKQRYLEAAAYEPGGCYKADMVVGSGTKEEIIALLKSADFPIELNKTYGELLDLWIDL